MILQDLRAFHDCECSNTDRCLVSVRDWLNAHDPVEHGVEELAAQLYLEHYTRCVLPTHLIEAVLEALRLDDEEVLA